MNTQQTERGDKATSSSAERPKGTITQIGSSAALAPRIPERQRHESISVPTKNDSGVYIRGCSWSICGEPVPGWISKDTPRIKYRGRKRIRYTAHNVQACPLFEKG